MRALMILVAVTAAGVASADGLPGLAPLGAAELGAVRGGLMGDNGLQATYVNGALVQSVVIPTINVVQGASGRATASLSGAPVTPSTPLPLPGASSSAAPSAPQVVLSSGSFGQFGGGLTVQGAPASLSVGAAGGPTIVTTVGANGLSNVVANAANNQLVQQVTRLDIAINGIPRPPGAGDPAGGVQHVAERPGLAALGGGGSSRAVAAGGENGP